MTDLSKMPIAAWKVTLDGEDLTDKLKPRLISLTLTEKRGGEADQLEIVIDDKDGLIAMPKKGVKLKVSMGWRQGTGLPQGLIDKGEFKVDETGCSGPPDIITIRARSADLTSAFRTRRERHFVGKSVKEIVTKIATDNGYSPHIDATLGAKVIPALGTGPKSDAALLKELGKTFDATATVKAGALIFAPIGTGKTASGETITAETIDRKACGAYTFAEIDRGQYAGVEAKWHSKGTAKHHTVLVEIAGGEGEPKRLRKVYATEADAQYAAESEAARITRAKFKFDTTLPLGRPDLYPDKPIKLTGFKPEINDPKWLIADAAHTMDGSGGLVTKLTLETSA